jgi:hypothetical protein
VEIGLALSASSLATLKPLFRRLKILASTRRTERSETKHTTQGSTLPSRKMAALSLGFGSSSRIFTPVEEEGLVNQDGWPIVPGEKAGDIEMGNLGDDARLNKKVASVSVKNVDGFGKSVPVNFSLRHPPPVRPPPLHIRSFMDI